MLIKGKDAFSMHRQKGSGLRVCCLFLRILLTLNFRLGKAAFNFPFLPHYAWKELYIYISLSMCVCAHVYVCTCICICVHREENTWVVDACTKSAMTKNYKLSDLSSKNSLSPGFGGCKFGVLMWTYLSLCNYSLSLRAPVTQMASL